MIKYIIRKLRVYENWYMELMCIHMCSVCYFLCVCLFAFMYYVYMPLRLHSNESMRVADGHRAPLYF